MLLRSTFREIRQSFGRFITIFVIIALGVGFYTGLKISTTAMVKTGDVYISNSNFYDFYIMNTLGYTDDDVEAALELEGVEYAEGAYNTSAFFNIDGVNDEIFIAHSITENVNKLQVISGRMPESPNECVIDSRYMSEEDIGTKITLSETNDEDTLENFKYQEYTVVGIVSSPLYLNYERGQVSIGDGSISAFIFIPYDGFNVDYFSEIYITLTQKEYLYSDEYDALIEEYKDEIDEFAEERADLRYKQVYTDAEGEISDGEQELLDAKAEYNKAINELDDAWNKLEEAQRELADGWAEYDDARATLAKEYIEASNKIYDAKAKLHNAYVELNDGEVEYSDGLREYNDGVAELEEAKKELDEAAAQLTRAKRKLQAAEDSYDSLSGLNTVMSMICSQTGMSAPELCYAVENDMLSQDIVDQIDSQLSSYGMTLNSVVSSWRSAESSIGQTDMTTGYLSSYLSDLKKTIDDGWDEYYSGLASYNKGKDEYNEGLAELEDAKAELDEARKELDDGWDEYYSGMDDVLDAEEELATEMKAALEELEEAEADLTEGEKEYYDGLKEYLDAKAEAEPQLADAAEEIANGEQELIDAREDLASLEYPTSYNLDRSMNTGYACFDSDTAIVEGLAKIFPLFFLVVAALVCITTMTRMVDENRGQIGTLKALGYGKWAIMQKFLIYSGTASILGCIVGFYLGSYIFPTTIWTAYKLMYDFSEIIIVYDYKLGFVSSAAYLVCAVGATYYSCYSELSEAPAQIMRPRAPKSGKRILLERIPFLWKRFSFLYKVSARNIFRYKKRLFMMLIGIAGSTALLITGFGINDSIKDVVNYQYDEITLYDYIISFNDDMSDIDREAFEAEIGDGLSDIVYLHSSGTTAKVSSVAKDAQLIVAEEGSLEGFFSLNCDGQPVSYPEKGEVVINNGLADALGVEIGDTITLEDADMKQIRATVSGIIDNHVDNYAFINIDTYEEYMGTVPEMKTAFALISDGEDVHKVGADLLKSDYTVSVTISQDVRDRINNMMESLNYIVILVIACAGALAFTVIYNLTNINITERIREIATIKVLGFNAMETAQYVFRENMIMTGMGALLGLVLGKLLHAYVMGQIKVDLMSFDIRISPISYLYAIIATFIFAIIVAFFMFFKLKKINMAESLKSIE